MVQQNVQSLRCPYSSTEDGEETKGNMYAVSHGDTNSTQHKNREDSSGIHMEKWGSGGGEDEHLTRNWKT